MATKADKARYDKLHAIGCIACRKEGRFSQVDIHHIVDKGYRKHSGGSAATIPLCPWHHRGIPLDGMRINETCGLLGPCLAKHKKYFIQRYGDERSLLAEVDALILKL